MPGNTQDVPICNKFVLSVTSQRVKKRSMIEKTIRSVEFG